MRKTTPLILGLIWLVALIVVQVTVVKYESTPATAQKVAAAWPQGTSIWRAPQGTTLVLLAHPQCPCTRATMTELEKILAQTQGHLAVRALFFKPKQAAPSWVTTGLWSRANALPGAVSVVDEDGRMARKFHLRTSGEVAVFNAEGQLLFQGGITLARGHEGDNAGEDAVVQLVTTGHSSTTHTPVFGCEVLPSSSSATNSAAPGATDGQKNLTRSVDAASPAVTS